MGSLFDISSYKKGAIAAGLYYLLQTEMATNTIEGIIHSVSEKSVRTESQKAANARDTPTVTLVKAVIAMVAYRFLDNMIFGEEISIDDE